MTLQKIPPDSVFGFPRTRKPVWGITGGIGSGKSTVGNLIATKLGGMVIDADRIGHFALFDPQIKEKIVNWGGEGLLEKNGELSRARLASLVFPNTEKLRAYESIIHPWIRQRLGEELRKFDEESPEKLLILDASLLWESGWHQSCCLILHVEVPFETRARRVQNNRNWTPEMLILRESVQMPLTLKASMADYCVSNSGSMSLLPSHLDSLLTRVTTLGHLV